MVYVLGGIAFIAVVIIVVFSLFIILFILKLLYRNMSHSDAKRLQLDAKTGIMTNISTGKSQKLFLESILDSDKILSYTKMFAIGLLLSWLGIVLAIGYLMFVVIMNLKFFKAFKSGNSNEVEKLINQNHQSE